MKCIQFLLLIAASVLVSCTDQPNGGLLVEPVGSAHYLIHNQTDSDLQVDFITSQELNFETASALVTADSSRVIFTDGIIGINPKPSNSFSSIRFYSTEDLTAALLVLEPIEDNDWVIISRDFDDSGYGLTEYELTVTDQDLE